MEEETEEDILFAKALWLKRFPLWSHEAERDNSLKCLKQGNPSLPKHNRKASFIYCPEPIKLFGIFFHSRTWIKHLLWLLHLRFRLSQNWLQLLLFRRMDHSLTMADNNQNLWPTRSAWYTVGCLGAIWSQLLDLATKYGCCLLSTTAFIFFILYLCIFIAQEYRWNRCIPTQITGRHYSQQFTQCISTTATFGTNQETFKKLCAFQPKEPGTSSRVKDSPAKMALAGESTFWSFRNFEGCDLCPEHQKNSRKANHRLKGTNFSQTSNKCYIVLYILSVDSNRCKGKWYCEASMSNFFQSCRRLLF